MQRANGVVYITSAAIKDLKSSDSFPETVNLPQTSAFDYMPEHINVW